MTGSSKVRAGAVVVLVLLVGACGSSDDPGADAAPPTTAATDARCGVQQDDGSFDEVDCTEAHDGELAGVVAGPGQVPEPADVEGSDGSEVYTDLDLVRSCVAPVSGLTGESLDTFGIDVAYVIDSEPGEGDEAEVECWAWSRAEGALSASIAEVGLAEALGDHAPIGSLAPGDCFVFTDPDEDSFDIVTPTACDGDDAQVVEVLGSVELDGEYPGADAVSDDGDDGCGALGAEAASEVDGSATSFLFPTERSWEALGQSTVICLIERSAAGQETAEAYCLTVPEGSLQGVETDCSAPHNAELVGVGEPPAGALPDDPVAVSVAIAEICRPVAAMAMGLDVLPEYLSTGSPPEATPGAVLTEPFDCFIKMDPDDVLTGSVFDTDLADLLGDYVAVVELEPGDCFSLVEANYNVAVPADCSDADALMAIGSFQTDEDGPYPGADALREIRSDGCRSLLEDSGLDIDPATVSGNIPAEAEWDYADVRTITCEGTPS